jgi:mono/diheme cytochrome c family protein
MNLPIKFRRFFAIPLIFVLIILGALLLHPRQLTAASAERANYQDEADEAGQPDLPDLYPDSAEGLAIHTVRCANCHGEFGLGDGELAAGLPNPPAAHASLDFIRAAVPAELFSKVTEGVIDRGMPPFGPASSNPLSEDQRWNVIAALYSLGTPMESVERGQEIYEDNCVSCHGVEGGGDGPGAVEFEGLPLDIASFGYWSNISNQAVFDQLKGSDLDGAHEFDLADDDLYSTIDFIRTFNYQYVDALAPLHPIEEGTISGRVDNGTTDETLTSELVATLRGFTPELQMSVVLSDTLGTDGMFHFGVADVPQDLFYRVSVDYGGIDFSSDFGQLAFDNPELELPITVYENSSDPGIISIDQLHIILDFGQDFVNVSEFYVASNNEPVVYVGETGQAEDGTFLMSLPTGAQNPVFQRGFGSVDSFIPANEVITTGSGWADTFPVRPGAGTLNMLVQYTLPYEDEAAVSHLIHYPTSLVNLVIPESGVSLKSGGDWTDTGQQVMGTAAVATYGQTALPENSQLTISLEGKPQSAAPTPAAVLTDNKTELLVGGAVALAVLIIAAVVLRQWRQRPAPAIGRQALIQEIALLDEAFELGKIGQEDYQRQREELKAELIDLWTDENNSS